ncbi:hypothetical protein BpHYR1_034553 [Brachionus plicatilis]|uniref:Uncharacterized protein n=1 Tax=Brachionus plicatilis TaxID=10195 RepID=A0A3M7R0M5_BRAPC|nr:hypothetical protein BpHYR1_034553 [Brachionus plicatilis]
MDKISPHSTKKYKNYFSRFNIPISLWSDMYFQNELRETGLSSLFIVTESSRFQSSKENS